MTKGFVPSKKVTLMQDCRNGIFPVIVFLPNGEHIYDNRRPSRITQLRFWKWYENEFFRNKQERERVKRENARIKQRVAEILKEGRSKKSVHPS